MRFAPLPVVPGFLRALLLCVALACPWNFSAAQVTNDSDAPTAMPRDWQAAELRDHPLVGVIWSARDKRAVAPAEFGAEMAKTRFILLGEIHDNPDHHRLQAWEIETLGAWASFYFANPRDASSQPTISRIAMEMLSDDQQSGITAFYDKADENRGAVTGADFGPMVGWDTSGWPAFDLYKPLLIVALASGWEVVPASPEKSRVKTVSQGGLEALPGPLRDRLALDKPLGLAMAKDLEAELAESHCGLLPPEALPRMAFVQRFRDAMMADALAPGADRGAILIAGNGHVRRDRGVPWYLTARGVPRGDIGVVMHMEVEADKTDAAAYLPSSSAATTEAPVADYLVFTPRQTRPDPCEGLRERFKKPRNGQDR